MDIVFNAIIPQSNLWMTAKDLVSIVLCRMNHLKVTTVDSQILHECLVSWIYSACAKGKDKGYSAAVFSKSGSWGVGIQRGGFAGLKMQGRQAFFTSGFTDVFTG